MINAHGGINGQHVRFISLDDARYSPAKNPRTDQTRLVEEENVWRRPWGRFSTPTNAAIQTYLNERRVPQLFIEAGASRWNDPAHFPWTMPFVNLLRSEAKVYASAAFEATGPAPASPFSIERRRSPGRDYLDA